uniref:Uncharacterized protein n=1 Tax=Onchocerca volvulus TaxID=6282 RepID=A0A8R1TTX9_ONCVO
MKQRREVMRWMEGWMDGWMDGYSPNKANSRKEGRKVGGMCPIPSVMGQLLSKTKRTTNELTITITTTTAAALMPSLPPTHLTPPSRYIAFSTM